MGIIDQNGIIAYANNEIDTEWMLAVIYDLIASSVLLGDVNEDGIINILDIVAVINFVLLTTNPNDTQFTASDMNSDGIINILDIVIIVNLILS